LQYVAKGEPMPSKVFLYVFDGVVEDCHSVAILFIFQAGPVWMLGWPNMPFRVWHKSQDHAGRIGKAGPIKNLETPLPHDINSFFFIL